MKENLLQKLTFKYLAPWKKTGFGKGQLVKMITITEMMAGEKIDMKPRLVLHVNFEEADKTNSW